MKTRFDNSSARRRRMFIALAWLLAGSVLLLLTPLTGRSESLGWTPTFWLLLAPMSLLLALRPTLPLQVLASVVRGVGR
jgi:hypothetical protein